MNSVPGHEGISKMLVRGPRRQRPLEVPLTLLARAHEVIE
jgi:hypothetical protein